MELTEDQCEQIAPLFPVQRGECTRLEPAGVQCHPVCCEAWLQMEGIAVPVRTLAYHIHPDEPLVEEQGSRMSFR